MTGGTQRSGGERLRVAAGVVERDGRILVARRRAGRFGGMWEFPGGKLEAGEGPEQGLERELAEEFGVRSRIGAFICAVPYDGPALRIELLVYRAELLPGDLLLRDHDEIRWLLPSEMDEAAFSEPDRPVVRLLAAGPASPGGTAR